MKRGLLILVAAVAVVGALTLPSPEGREARNAAYGVERFPPPDLPAEYVMPQPTTPAPRGDLLAVLDVVVLLAALLLASYSAIALRSRRWILGIMIFSLLYFGFWRRGCVCPIGAIGNVSAALAGGYVLPAIVAIFFLAPLVTTLAVGRSFCAAVCPLGAVQDIAAIKPLKVPFWLEHGLGLLAYVYLGLAVLLAWTGSGYIICQYDPFVSFFRLAGPWNMLVLGMGILAIGMFFARPYCRLLCPYGVILRLLSRVSWKRVKITPAECIRCRLCEDACPYGAIRPPTDGRPIDRRRGKLVLAGLIVLLPVLVAGGALALRPLGPVLARANTTVQLAERIAGEQAGAYKDTIKATEAFYRAGNVEARINALDEQAGAILHQFDIGSLLLGGWIGLVVGVKLIYLYTRRQRRDWEADAGACLSCGRCYRFCPVDRAKRTGDYETLEKLKARLNHHE